MREKLVCRDAQNSYLKIRSSEQATKSNNKEPKNQSNKSIQNTINMLDLLIEKLSSRRASVSNQHTESFDNQHDDRKIVCLSMNARKNQSTEKASAFERSGWVYI
uniref:AlNc14C147G7431 protein n=1 Tax=Albugo laibachii Nc14 TaxID=890382 RepID=F0WLP3_9STRA|nr:AlNc14C147G7431 [Albugo laibachii Nc14]|eukprot:CCA22209.1 AlNc14C147G7431 [Albugo laibachii Nc14]